MFENLAEYRYLSVRLIQEESMPATSQPFLAKTNWFNLFIQVLGGDFLVSQMVKNLPCNEGDPGSIPGSERSSGEGNGYPLEYSCLENYVDRGAWCATIHVVVGSDTTERLTLSYFSMGTKKAEMENSISHSLQQKKKKKLQTSHLLFYIKVTTYFFVLFFFFQHS